MEYKKRRTVLIVDDEHDILEVVSEMLEGVVDDIYIANNGIEALDIISMHDEIDCILCDLVMPKMNGIELLKEVKKGDRELPFIFFSAYGSNQAIDEVIELGAFDFIDKPELADLEKIIKRGLMTNFDFCVGQYWLI